PLRDNPKVSNPSVTSDRATACPTMPVTPTTKARPLPVSVTVVLRSSACRSIPYCSVGLNIKDRFCRNSAGRAARFGARRAVLLIFCLPPTGRNADGSHGSTTQEHPVAGRDDGARTRAAGRRVPIADISDRERQIPAVGRHALHVLPVAQRLDRRTVLR